MTGSMLQSLEGHSEMIMSLVFSADGRWILGSHQNGNYPRKSKSACVWNSNTGTLYRTFPGHRNSVDCVAISPDNRLIATSSINDPISVWDFETEQCLFTFTPQTKNVTNLAFALDGSKILTKSRDNIIRGWNSKDGTPDSVSEADELHFLKGSCQTGLNLSVSPTGTVRVKRMDGMEVDIEQQRNGDYAVLEKAPGKKNWRLARAKGEYWRYVNYATDEPEGRVLWSADVLGQVSED
jgi:WD40 repeat protein